MNYLHSSEYKEGKDLLTGEYSKIFQTIESYYIQVYTEQSYEVQLTLSQILGDFLEAQRDSKPLEKLIGGDTKEYAVRMLKTEYDTHKGKGYWISTAIIFCWCILFMMLVKTSFMKELEGLPLMERMEHIYFSIDIIIFIILAYICDYVRAKLAAVFFYRPKATVRLRALITVPMSLFVISYLKYSKPEQSNLAVRVPVLPFLMLVIVTTVYLIIVICVSVKNTSKKKRELEGPEILPEQMICPSCGKECDCDYPKCPYCGHKFATELEKLYSDSIRPEQK
jgi:DNA-binding ferritin-like protein (Dps family)